MKKYIQLISVSLINILIGKLISRTVSLVCLLVVYTGAYAASISFSGASGGNWNVAANWSGGVLPTADDVVTITGKVVNIVSGDNVVAGSITLTNSGTASVGTLTIQSGATLTVSSTSVTPVNLNLQGGTINNAGTLSVIGRSGQNSAPLWMRNTSGSTTKMPSTVNNTGTLILNASAISATSSCVVMSQADAGVQPTINTGGTITFVPKNESGAFIFDIQSPDALITGNGILTAGTEGTPLAATFMRILSTGTNRKITINENLTINYLGTGYAFQNYTSGTSLSTSTVVNKGTINLAGTSNNPIFMTSQSTHADSYVKFENQGTIAATGAPALSNSGAITFNNSNPSVFINSGVIIFNPTADGAVINTSSNLAKFTFTNTGSITVGATTPITNAIVMGAGTTTLTNTGSITIGSGSIKGLTGTGNAVFNNNTGGAVNLTNATSGSLGAALTFINNGGTVVDNASSPVLNATVSQYVEAGRNWYISSPVSLAPYTVLNRGARVVEFNETTKAWDNVISGTLIAGRGYIQVANATEGLGTTGNIDFTGLTNSGNVTLGLTRTGTTQAGFNLAGNPYPSYLDWTMVAAANPNVLPSFWYRTKDTEGAYTFATVNVEAKLLDDEAPAVIVTGNATSAVTTLIPPMQAYWVRLLADQLSNDITVTNSMRKHRDTPSNIFKVPRQDGGMSLIRVQVSNASLTDEAVIYFNANATDSYDRFDSPKMFSNSASRPEIYTIADTEKLVINGMKTLEETIVIPLGFSTGQGGDFSFSLTEWLNFEPGIQLIVNDKLTSTETDISNGAVYSFESEIVNTAERFELVLRIPGVVSSLDYSEKTYFRVFANQNQQLVILAPEKANYSVYNAMGISLAEGQTTTSETIVIPANGDYEAAHGFYLVKLIHNGVSQVIKTVVH